jgi:hypothetical protein
MLIALLAVLGVDLAVVVALAAVVLSRRRWVSRQPGAFRGAIRPAGEKRWRRGYGRWVRDVLVWTKAPFLMRNELLPADGVAEQRLARPGEVRRLGDRTSVIRLRVGDAALDVAADFEHAERLLGPYRSPERRFEDATTA